MLQSLSKPFSFYIAAQILPWVCQLQQFLQQLFCSENNESSTTEDYTEETISYRPDRIVGGVPAKISEAPYLLSMQIYNRHFCTASIISPSWALTAAQCFPKYYPIVNITVYGGTDRVPSFGYAHKLSKVHKHPKFTWSGPFPRDDIAVIKPETEFEHITGKMEPIPLRSKDDPFPDYLATIFGWGVLKENEYPLPTYLHKAFVPALWWTDCEKFIPSSRTIFCAGYFEGGVSPCHGDVGVPFVMENKLYGIFSWSKSCGHPENPSLYTYVSSYRKWIKSIARV